ncbi:MAG: tetraacyldisaccharide 4'-kinase [Nitrospirae bacterium]|nr:tetraacyldisaccharide 4'-kinase [Nitrospirota bacterium]MCL5421695.1 tetraacyldisaccharide 4'-kinase [Nitrospirota bacterium]
MGPLEFIYYLGYSFNKSRSLKNQERLPHKVISVGNLTVGGTGKTPAVIAIAEEAKKRGYLPCILTRGYRGKVKGPCLISKGEGPLLSVDEAGDEASLMAEKLRGVPVVKGKNRYEAGMFAIRHLEPFATGEPAGEGKSHFLFILDDGFQHWRLYRDMDILLIDSTNPFGNNKLLPMGRLREPLKEMKRADIIVLTKVQKEAEGLYPVHAALTTEIRRYNPAAPIYSSEHRAMSLRTLSGRDLPLDVLSGKAVLAFCGIGSPSSFRETLLKMKTDVRGFMAFMDHHAYDSRDLQRIMGNAGECNADWIVTTEKDIMRLKGFEGAENLVALSIAFRAEQSFYDEIFAEG